MHDPKEIRWYERRGLTPPSHVAHGTEDDIRKKLKPLKPKSWKLEGNRLIAETELGPVVNYIDPSYILTGEKDGLPIFKKI